MGGGGASTSGQQLTGSIPLKDGSPATTGTTPNGWRVTTGGNNSSQSTVYVVCAK